MAAKAKGARAIALVGPNGSGKTTLLEALLFAAGAVDRQGSVEGRNSIGDASPEARAHGQSVEINLASFSFMDDRYAVVDAPGSVEFQADADAALAAMDLALVVVDPEPDKAILIQPILKQLERLGVPHAIFVNKVDQARGRVRDLLAALQPMSSVPLVARQLPIWEKDEQVSGFVDLALERVFVYRPGKPSEQRPIPADLADSEAEARFHMLEQLADFDDELMEQLLSDITPSQDAVFADLVRETREGLIAPVFFGSALNGFGVRRLLKALRHDTPDAEAAAARLGADGDCAYAFKTAWAGQAGKLVYARVLAGRLNDGAELTLPNGEKARASGLFQVLGSPTKKISLAERGEVVALGKVEAARAGDLLSGDGKARKAKQPLERRKPVYVQAISTSDRKDDVRLSGALTKLLEEDPSLVLDHDQATHATLLAGQGDTHLKVALERLKRRYGVEVRGERPSAAYRETIRKKVTQRGRHKKQTGGHGQFGDVVLEVAPRERGAGFVFSERISGGVVPKQWIPAVEDGVRDAMERGPLGFPVVDVEVVLTDGSYHSVDSSELAFRTAGRIGMSDALKTSDSYLLEPIDKVTIHAPTSATSRITSAISTRRGQILGYDTRDGWPGWDQIEAFLPEAERHDLIMELRSATQGLGSYEATFSHMAEVTGRLAEEIAHKARSAA